MTSKTFKKRSGLVMVIIGFFGIFAAVLVVVSKQSAEVTGCAISIGVGCVCLLFVGAKLSARDF